MSSKSLANLLLLCFLTAASTPAEPIRFQISDALNDGVNGATIDLTGLILDFDTSTGAYTVTVQASAANPFAGSFRVNLYFLNPDTGLGISTSAMLIDTLNDFTFTSPSTSVVLTGSSDNLKIWKIGDRVAINSIPFGVPPNFGLSFISGIIEFNGSAFAGSDRVGGIGSVNYANLTAGPAESTVPEPGSGILFGAGAASLLAAAYLRRTRRG